MKNRCLLHTTLGVTKHVCAVGSYISERPDNRSGIDETHSN